MMSDHDQIMNHLKSLHMPTMRRSYEEMADQARAESWGYEQYLLQLLNLECEVRWQNRIARNLRASKLPPSKTFENFDKKRLPIKVANHLNVLIDGSFLSRSENILAFGNPGSGKTHLLCAIGHELIAKGKQVLFISCSQLVQELLIAKRELELTKKLKSLSRFDAVIIDDIGYVQQSREEMEVLFTFLADRYEQGSLMITSNLPFSKWEQIFKDPMTTAAAIDRLVHHSIIFELNVESYRMEQAKKEAR
ncbi:IS21-like element helper ATPase IstB [Desulfobacula toluolica]|uniref:IstB2: IstB-like ATP-binding protein, transposase IS21 family n=1 Tax=Desulfobacula toluolica (strain DSM 7467 / Tol2) TaxID=651182 RepID=K0NHW7_DESTT|nr:IS21-like element helper ATPase IstB [Desulfobacula toluolica]CCK79587.1 predicted transposase, IS21 family [Desulfobacula toluolica Tol2]CCK79663.1 IstB2: IstB-like ATP-binding protein, transposase IS21 family [Desulfobacula toluolica Tol2]CCK80023.1 IstB4: IstB-like ATP-binding protein, transposase IS21 family [Desulfobacula toluolica Tol2]CCK80525.1 transposase, IS21 family [Desulfobacula toluolica Tol2]CCK80789.1 IstB5: IstB-like ATP-binding protein, transposase IS21 family [Desulfobacu